MDSPSISAEVFQLNSVSGGLRPGSISFKNVTLESEKYVCVRDVQGDGPTSLVIVDLEKRESIRNNVKDAESCIMNPKSKILALRSGRNLQVFDVDASRRLKATLFHEDVAYWRWIDDRTLGVVTAKAVYHWSLDTAADDAPQHIFDRSADYDSSVQVLSYRSDEQKKWLVVTGVARDPSGIMVGKALLYSVENRSSRVLDGHACCFISTSTPSEPRKCNVMCLAWNSPQQGGQVMIMELPTGSKTDLSMLRRVYSVNIQPGDFPVAMNVSDRHKLLTVATSRGSFALMDIFTGTILVEQQFSSSVVFCGAADNKVGGVLCVNNQGAVMRIGPNDNGIIGFVKNRMHNAELALRIASTANLGGVDDLFKVQLDNFLRNGNVEEAVRMCLRAPGNSLRTREILMRFMQMPQQPGQPPAISTYFKIALAETSLNECESVELARAVVPKGGIGYVKQQFEEGKLTASEELGDLVQQADSNMALKIFHQGNAHTKVLNLLLQRNETQKAVEYCKRANFSPDWRVIMNNFIRVAPQDAVNLGLMLYREMGDRPVLTADEVVDMFVSAQQIQQATEFLLEILRDHNDESTMELQTKLLEMNLKYSHPSVADKIFVRKICQCYDGMKLAPLCERAGLHQHAIDCYIMAQKQDSDLNNLASIRRCLQQLQNFNPEWLVDFFGKLNKQDSLKCLEDLCTNSRHNFKVIVQVATKYSDALGAADLIDLFLEHSLYDVLYYYLGAVVPYTRDAEVHFRYIEAAAEMGQMQELERMTRESPCYDAERTKNYLKSKKLTDMWPFINVCDQHNMVNEMVHYLVETGNESCIEQYLTRRSPGKTPQVVQALIECNVSEEFIKNMLTAVGTMCPIEELVDCVEEVGRLHLIKQWLEDRRSEKKTDKALYNALAKIYVDIGQSPEQFLSENEYYDSQVVGKYCETRDPNLAYIAYCRGHCSEMMIDLCHRNGMHKQLARYLVKEQNLDLWASVLGQNSAERQQLIESVQQIALPESESSEEVSTTVRAFMNANLTEELTSLLGQIVVHGRFRRNRFLENLLIMSAVRARKDKVMEYVTTLEDYDAKDIAHVASGAGMHEIAFVVYTRHNMQKEAITVLLQDMNDVSRGRAFAQKTDAAVVWSVLGEYLVKQDEVHEGIECLIRAKNPDLVVEVTSAAERTNQFGDLIKYLTMARQCSRAKDNKIDTALVITYAKTGRLEELEEFLKETHNVKIGAIADKCFQDKLYESARVLYTVANNYARVASTEVMLSNLSAAVEAAKKAKSIHTYKEVNLACIEAGDLKLAGVCAVPVVLKAEEVSGMCNRYESRGLWEELFSVLRNASSHQGAHMSIFTEMGVLLAKYRPEKLMEHVNMYAKKINTHKMITVCEQYHHWVVLRVLHINNEDWLAATNSMMQHHADAFDHEIFKDAVSHLGASDLLYTAIGFYLKTHPEQLNDFLSSIFKRVDPERVMTETKKVAPIHVIRTYLEAAQERNAKKVNEALNNLYIEEEDFKALRHSVETYNNFDSEELSSRLEKMELFEFRKIALLLHRKNKRYSHAVAVAKENELFEEAIDTAAESGDSELVSSLLDYFVKDYPECFAACLYTCYDLLKPATVLQKAWLNQRTEMAMPYMIQVLQDYSNKIEKMEKSMMDAQTAAKDAARRAGPVQGPGSVPLMIEQGGGMPMNGMPVGAPPQLGFGMPPQFGSGRPF
ncbi:clathrin heavy chain [Leishmania donovani]|uniref:Clathrin heavy chain n=3 Tax=Leishmania donovani species complex TaxID=38574 RepID=A0A6L0XRJ2_LEIIN|nr:putative clathrin heavy chain [Leishmania infantum JPCM5]CAC9549781.1 clathrin_heavy_chain_-_putative [Leishmania infantum]CAJ1993530.1 clathrin heavy chain [Leishmania donovani]CAM72864.1 putative clathrin heavy chain [Leishmania infantum JPCM5]SUZ46542.1 clathrin_heavy_chain_-_putative [Leishmania infantum]VDZ49356.1 clathrin_heavy_chain_putative/GeneDB:LmjF.36.1630 [Leishmania donovani]|eukprot:XP_001469752.1 putative clathrin heavy chain [Leishmania infantum JPCM5]